MPDVPMVVALDDGTRIDVTAARTEWGHDDALMLYNADDQEVGEFPGAEWCCHADHLR